MAFPAGSPVTGTFQSVLHVIPVRGMGVYPQAGFSAVAFQAGITLGMAALAGGQVLACFAGVARGPFMDWQDRVLVAYLAHIVSKGFMRHAGCIDQAPAFSMGLDCQVLRRKTDVAVDTEFIFMTARAKLRIVPGCDGMGHIKIRVVYVDHAIAQFTHFVGESCLMTIQAEFL